MARFHAKTNALPRLTSSPTGEYLGTVPRVNGLVVRGLLHRCEACRPAAAGKGQGPEEPTLLTAARIGPEGPEEPTLLTAARIGTGRSPRSRTQRKLRSPAALASVDSGACTGVPPSCDRNRWLPGPTPRTARKRPR